MKRAQLKGMIFFFPKLSNGNNDSFSLSKRELLEQKEGRGWRGGWVRGKMEYYGAQELRKDWGKPRGDGGCYKGDKQR